MSDLTEINATSLIEDFKSIHNDQKIMAIKNIKTIILCLGKHRTINEFIPFLTEFCEEEDDIVVIEVNNQLINILEYVDNIYPVFELWEKIAFMEELTIKNSSVTVMEQLFSRVSDTNFFNKLISRLEEFFNQKEYFIVINLTLYLLKTNNSNESLIQLLLNLTKLEEYNSIKETIKVLDKIANHVTLKTFIKILTNILKQSEFEASVRVNLIKPMGLILSTYKSDIKLLNNKEYNEFTDLLQRIFKVEDVKLKINIIENSYYFLVFTPSFPETFAINTYVYDLILGLVVNSNQDQEQKLILCRNLEPVFIALSEVSNDYLTILKNLNLFPKEQNSNIRKSFASNILKILAHLKKNEIIEIIFPLFLDILRDENMEVRLEILNNLELLNNYIPIDSIFDSIYNSLLDIANCKSWRVRFLLKSIPFEKVLSSNVFIENIFPIYISWLSDPVYAIRKDSGELINQLISKYPECHNIVLNKIKELKNSSSYLLKVSLASFIEKMALNGNLKFVEDHLIQTVLELGKSDVSNVIINCEKTIKALSHVPEIKAESHFILSLVNKYKNQ